MAEMNMLTESKFIGRLPAFMASATVIVSIIGIGSVLADNPGESGIRGTVLIGAIHPGPTRMGESELEPASVRFAVMQGDEKITEFKSGKDGKFETILPPGDYKLVPHKDTLIPMAEQQSTLVTVHANSYASVRITLETGMK